MVSLEDAVIARLEAGGHRFEILVDPNEAQAFKEGDEIDWEDSIAVDGVWADSAKGERSPENILNDFFESSDLINIYINQDNCSNIKLLDWWIDAGTPDRILELEKKLS